MHFCCICHNSNVIFCITNAYNNDNTTYIELLKFIVPEVDWNCNDCICETCVKDLKIAYKFKELCLNSIYSLQTLSGKFANNQTPQEEEHLSPFHDTHKENIKDEQKSNIEVSDNDCWNNINREIKNPSNKSERLAELVESPEFPEHSKKESLCPEVSPLLANLYAYQCKICQEYFQDEHNFKNHKKVHKPVCDKWDKSYNSVDILEVDNLAEHSDRRNWKRKRKFSVSSYLFDRSKKCHASAVMSNCFDSNLSVNDKNMHMVHVLEHPKINEAHEVSSITDRYAKIENNTQNEQLDKEIKTEQVFSKSGQLKINSTSAESNPSIKDNAVGIKESKRNIAFDVRKENKSNRKDSASGKRKKPLRTFSCEGCSLVLRSSIKLIKHCVTEHNADPKSVKPFACDECEKKFSTSTVLIEHKKYHSKDRQYICSFCGKGFVTKNDLTCHEYIHYNERSFKCELCDKGFNTQKNLRTHRIVKHGNPESWKHCCPICNKRFPILSNYKVHVSRHLGDKKFCCHLCDKKFVNKDELRQHLVSHLNLRE